MSLSVSKTWTSSERMPTMVQRTPSVDSGTALAACRYQLEL